MTVGDTPAVARAKSMLSPATEFTAIDAFVLSAAIIWHRGYDWARESIERTKSFELIRWLRGMAAPSALIPADRFWCTVSSR